ncbi:MAG TPA: aspartate ammonia-lyase [Phycisphaerae bacterium]|nr:aspartate ammonia-lyase [Phycisphaerae bacterium]
MAKNAFRTEKDTLGEVKVPAGAYWGAQTQRAVENFPVSGLRAHPALVRAHVMVKLAAARANARLGKLDARRAGAIEKACLEVLEDGRLLDQWVVDVFQAGAGTSFNMNSNEILANRANEILGAPLGSYKEVHPNDHVNMSQSTNDTFPTAMQVACVALGTELLAVLDMLAEALEEKGRAFDGIVKSGRTHLQDAVPVRLGQEFAAYAAAIRRAVENLDRALEACEELPLGGSAVGTGLNTHPDYAAAAAKHLAQISGLDLAPAEDLVHAMQSMAPVAGVSAALRNLALELARIANDLRLLSSGPRTGFGEIRLPAVQPGSSIMPGKVNPVMAECLGMVAMQVVGNDTAVALAVQAGQLELNVFMPVMAHNVLGSLEILKNFLPVFTDRCIRGIEADEARCRAYFESSVGLATILNSSLGYAKAAEIAKEAAATGKTLRELILEKKLMTEEDLARALDPKRVTEP